jgi:hypothetical protein
MGKWSIWVVPAQHFEGRLDAAFHDPIVHETRKSLTQLGGVTVNQVADVFKPAGRYKTCYVEPEYGRPLLSGAQLLQTSPINLKYMSSSVFKNIELYELKAGWIVYPADGRAEEELGTPVLITVDRDGWLASGHIGRIVPKKGVDSGWLFLALRTLHAQLQIKARASGSVVDSTFPEDMREVVLPPPLQIDFDINLAWADMATAQALEEEASRDVDNALLQNAA